MTKLRPPVPFKRPGRGRLPGQSDYGLDDVINIKVKDTTTYTIINRELVQVGNIGAGKYVEIDDTGINLYANSLEKISIETDGDLFLGTDLSAADTTHLAIFANNQTYNSESLGVGDLLLGSNSASKPNVLWDASAGDMKFRIGTTDNISIASTGTLIVQGSEVKLDNQTDGDLFIGRDTTDPDKTALAVFATGQTYNSESMGAGDVLIGSNSVTQHNLYWDDSAGAMYLRQGTTSRIEMDSSTILIGDSSTENIRVSSTNVRIRDGSTVYAELEEGILYLGNTSNENILISAASGINFREGSTSHAQLTTSTLRLGQTAEENILISSASGVNIRQSGTSYAQLSDSALRLGTSSNENIRITGSTLQIRDSSTVYTELSSSELILGRSGNENIKLTSSAMQFRDGSTVYTELSSSELIVGKSGNENIRITGSEMQIRDSSTVYSELSSGIWTIGKTSQEHIRIGGSSLQLKDGSTIYTNIGAGEIVVGPTTNENIRVTTSEFQIRDASTVYTELSSGTITVGRTSSDHVEIASNAVRIKDGSTVKGEWQTDGDIFIGNNISNPDDTYLAIFAGAQTYNSEGMGAGDMLIGDNSSSKANILWDKSAAQLKFRGGTSTELYIDTDGSLTAGAGDVILDSDGITLAAGSGTPNQYKIDDSSDNIFRVYSSVSSNTSNAFLISTGKNSSNHEALFQLKAITDDGSAHAGTAAVTLTGDTNTGWITLSCEVLSIPKVLRLTGLSSATISGLSPSNGWMVYNSSTNKFQGYAAGSWQDFH